MTDDEETDTANDARVKASLGELEVEVNAEDATEAEEVLERIWERRLDEVQEMAGAIRYLDRTHQ